MTEYAFDDKGKVKAPKAPENAGQEKDRGPLTRARAQGPLDASTVSHMQRTLGNQAVQRALLQRSGEGEAELDEETSSAINSARGGGQALDAGMAQQAGTALGQDFSGVRVHTDSNAAQLANQVNAKAFTIGNDIFYNDGQYSPGSQASDELTAHELTHVVQQGASTPGVQGKLTVNDPNDQYEKEADSVAQQIMSKREESFDVQRQEQPEEEEVLAKRLDVQRQEEEELALKRQDVQRQEDREDELQAQRLDRQPMEEEEEMLQPKRLDVQRQDEEEEVALKPLDVQREESADR